jgi:hypothetical protein
MGKTSTSSRQLSEKSTRGYTDFTYGIESSLCGKTLCKKTEIIEIRFIYEKELSMQMRKTLTFSRELPEKSTRGHTDFIYGIES